jgi:hypothetical protein
VVLKVVGNGGRCNLSTGKTFHFVGTGFTPGGKVMLLVFAPQNYSDPVYPNPYKLYWFQSNFGVYKADSQGKISTKPWDCRKGPGGKTDSEGSYEVRALDWPSGRTSRRAHFSDVR